MLKDDERDSAQPQHSANPNTIVENSYVGAHKSRHGQLYRVTVLHAKHYIGLAAKAQQQFTSGGDHIAAGLALFDRERAQLNKARAWLHTNSGDPETDALLLDVTSATVFIGYLRDIDYTENLQLFKGALEAVQ
ncbi:MAG TPA: hypothetical protein VFS21_04025 [Roseiflexaceae bacterium]|nr:hypothetical protein [Roseiflexaceae bacterium]